MAAQVLVLTRQDGSEVIAPIGSPFLAVKFEETFHHAAETAKDNGWLAFYSVHKRPPEGDELLAWLDEFIGSDIRDYVPPDPTATAGPDGSSPT